MVSSQLQQRPNRHRPVRGDPARGSTWTHRFASERPSVRYLLSGSPAWSFELPPTAGAHTVRRLAPPARTTCPDVVIHALGRFVLVRDGRPVPAGTWQSRKARDLLKILVARGDRPITRDALIEALWPNDDPARTPNRLAVALSRVRAVLDPDHRPHPHVVADIATVRLDHSRLRVDVDEFLSAAELGLSLLHVGRSEEALEHLELAEAAYKGDFLEEDLYAEWAVKPREELRATYISVARALAEIATASGDHDGSSRFALRILERDAYDERAHLLHTSALAAAGRYGQSRRAYHAYVTRMEEIGVEPAPIPVPRH